MVNERYLIKNKLGEGRSKVFLCNDIENPTEDVAIKILSEKADSSEKENFQNEFITLRRLKHPNIVQALNFGSIVKNTSSEKDINTGSKFFTLEYFSGKSLLDYDEIKNEESLRKIITQICSALFYLHQSDYIYYDLKPENILVKKVDEEPLVKLIDLGFAKISDSQQNELKPDKYIRGTAEFIAPELLKKEKHDIRVDLYSLGIILYRIIYKKFPFDTKNELKIYKAHLEQEFEFKKTKYSDELVTVIKKLLEKNPRKRYTNSLEVLSDLNIQINNKLVKDWSPAKIFVNRKDVLNILDTYIHDRTSSEIFSIKGFEGSGKTALAEEIDFIYTNSVLVKYDKSKSGYQFLKYFLKKIIFNDFIYPIISEETKKNLDNILRNSSKEFIDELKGIFARITQESNFTLILDDFNNIDNFTVEMLKDILPILQVNKIKIVVMEDSDYDYISDSFHNVKEINLTPFTDVQVSELLNRSYNKFFPVNELKKIILLYADLLPGSIEGFIKDCLQLNIFQYNPKQITINITEKTAKLLKSSHDQIYEVRLNSISKKGIEAVKILSLFELNLDEKILVDLLHSDKNETSLIVEELRDNNILHSLNIGANLQFTSEGFKKHAYSKIKNKKEYHLIVGKILQNKFPAFNRNELARQFELGEDFDTCYEILKEEIKDAEKISALSYKKGLLKHLNKLPLDNEKQFEIKLNLCRVLKLLNETSECLKLTEHLLKKNIDKEIEIELLIQKGKCLIVLNDSINGKKLLESILEKLSDSVIKEEVKLEIANANFNLSDYNRAEMICLEIINNNNSSSELLANAYNLIALIKIYSENDLGKALNYFQEALKNYSKINLKVQIAKMEINIGNIFNIKGDQKKAESYWNKALQTNLSIGNLLPEALITLNFGVFYFDKSNFNQALKQYKRAYDINVTYGYKYQQAQVLYNLGELFFVMCEYQKCIDSLKAALSIFKNMNNNDEEGDVIFLLGKLYYSLGNIKELKLYINEYSHLVNNTSTKKHSINIQLLNTLYFILIENIDNNIIDTLKEIRQYYSDTENNNNLIFTNFILIEYLIKLKKHDEALQELNDENFTKILNQNLFESKKEYLLGIIFKELNSSKNYIEMFNQIYEKLKEETVNELTWKVLFEITIYYFERGNYIKAKDSILYTKTVVNYLAEKIEDIELRKTYLNDFERKKKIKRLEYLESQMS